MLGVLKHNYQEKKPNSIITRSFSIQLCSYLDFQLGFEDDVSLVENYSNKMKCLPWP